MSGQAEKQQEPQEQQDRARTRLDTILRTYTAREVEVARGAVRATTGLGNAVLRTFRALREEQGMDLRGAGDLVRAVAQADGVWEQRAYPEDEITEALRAAAHAMAKAGTFTPEEWQEAAERINKAGVSAPDLVEPAPTRTPASRRVLGRGLAEIERAREPQDEAVLAFGTIGRTTAGEWTGFENVLLPEAREHDKRDLFSYRCGTMSMPALGRLTQRAMDEFLGTGTHRTQALRGALRFLTQEDLATVLAEVCAQLDGEHLREVMRMLGPDDLQAVNFATGEEIGARMIDAGVAQDFPVRPLTAEEEREPMELSQKSGSPLLEKDVDRALGILERDESFLPDEGKLAERLERVAGWNSVYAGEVAAEAWARYYRESEKG